MMTATIPNQDYKPLNDFLILWFKDLSLTVKKFWIDKHLQLKGWETSLWLLLKFQNKLGKEQWKSLKVSTKTEGLSNTGGGEDKLDCFLLA